MKYSIPFFYNLVDTMCCDSFHGNCSDFTDTSDRNQMYPRSRSKRLDHGYEIDIELPGFNQKEIDVELRDEVVSVKSKEDGKKTSRPFFWRQTIPHNVDKTKITAKAVDGMLTLVFPFKEEAKAAKIAIEAG